VRGYIGRESNKGVDTNQAVWGVDHLMNADAIANIRKTALPAAGG
jgi:hypothetical protein